MTLTAAPIILSSRGITLISLIAVLMTIATICLALRLHINIKHRKHYLTADALVTSAYMLYWGHATIMILTCIIGGFGFHEKDLDSVYLINKAKLGIGQEAAYPLELGLVKCSLCLLFRRIFDTRPYRIATTCVMILCICWTISAVLLAFLDCLPEAAAWATNQHGHCDDKVASWLAIGIVDVVLDLAILILPIPITCSLQMPLARKWGVLGIFGLGIITLIIGIARTVALSTVSLEDFTYTGYYAMTWSSIEPPIAIIVVSCMALRPLTNGRVSAIFTSIISIPSRILKGYGDTKTSSSDNYIKIDLQHPGKVWTPESKFSATEWEMAVV